VVRDTALVAAELESVARLIHLFLRGLSRRLMRDVVRCVPLSMVLGDMTGPVTTDTGKQKSKTLRRENDRQDNQYALGSCTTVTESLTAVTTVRQQLVHYAIVHVTSIVHLQGRLVI
jgi:hypothetical protein